MKVKSIILLGVLILGLVVAFFSCKEKDDYDWDSIEPIIASITGPATVRGGALQVYKATARGGSSYTFEAQMGQAIEGFTIVDGEPFAAIADLKESLTEILIDTIVVVETTAGGKSSPPKKYGIRATPLSINVVGSSAVVLNENEQAEREYTVDYVYPNAVYAWTITGDDATIIEGAGTSKIKVRFSYPAVDESTNVISLVLTTRRGNVIGDDQSVVVERFTPLAILLGTWTSGLSLGGGTCPQVVEVTAKNAAENSISMRGIADYVVNCYWGEAWIDGNGTIKLYMDEATGQVTIPFQWIGESDYPDHYFVQGYAFEEGATHHGVYNLTTPSISIKWNVGYGTSESVSWVFANPVLSEFTKSGTKTVVTHTFPEFNKDIRK